MKRTHEKCPRDSGVDLDRRRLLLTTGGLPFAGLAFWAFAGCSPSSEAPAPEGSEAEPAAAGTSAERPDVGPGPSGTSAKQIPQGAASSQSTAGGAPQTPSADALVTEIGGMQPIVAALQYVNESPKTDQQCSSCQLFTKTQANRGSCQLFQQGRVSASGWCTSWTQRKSG